MLDKKVMQFANFNITFGDNDEPMLEHLLDIIYPAFTSGIGKGTTKDNKRYIFQKVEIKLISEDYYMVGNLIKDTIYHVSTVMENGDLIQVDRFTPTSPYSRFLINLKNHRMILIKNESNSPDTRSFQSVVRSCLKKYINQINKDKKLKNKYPEALVNIVDIPFKENIDKELADAVKIVSLTFRMFKPNKDMSHEPMIEALHSRMKESGTNSASVVLNNPKNKETVKQMMFSVGDLAEPSLRIKDKNGVAKRIRPENLTMNIQLENLDRDICSYEDSYFLDVAKTQGGGAIINTSSENEDLYKLKTEALSKLLS